MNDNLNEYFKFRVLAKLKIKELVRELNNIEKMLDNLNEKYPQSFESIKNEIMNMIDEELKKTSFVLELVDNEYKKEIIKGFLIVKKHGDTIQEIDVSKYSKENENNLKEILYKNRIIGKGFIDFENKIFIFKL